MNSAAVLLRHDDPSYLLHDRDQLVGVARIGGITAILQGLCRLLRTAGLPHRRVTRTVAEQFRVIDERFDVRAIGPESLAHPDLAAAHVFVGHVVGGGTVPASAGLDAEQVVALGAAVGGHLVAAPAGFQ